MKRAPIESSAITEGGSEKSKHVTMSLKVPRAFRTELKLRAIDCNMKLNQLIVSDYKEIVFPQGE